MTYGEKFPEARWKEPSTNNTHAADIETIREALRLLGTLLYNLEDSVALSKAEDALDRLEADL